MRFFILFINLFLHSTTFGAIDISDLQKKLGHISR